MTNSALTRTEAFEAELAKADQLCNAGDLRNAFVCLERAHVLGQFDFFRHLRVHGHMLLIGWSAGDRREVWGQFLRIALIPLGHLTGRLPMGNTGGANVSAFQPMEVPPELKGMIEDELKH